MEPTEEQKKDFEERKKRAIEKMDAALTEEMVGIQLGLTGMPFKLQPVIIYQDVKKYEEKPNRKERRKQAAGK